MNLVADILDRVDRLLRERTVRVTVTGTSGSLVTIQRTGQSAPDAQSYPKLASYGSPTNGDEVIIQRVGDGWIVLGKVVR